MKYLVRRSCNNGYRCGCCSSSWEDTDWVDEDELSPPSELISTFEWASGDIDAIEYEDRGESFFSMEQTNYSGTVIRISFDGKQYTYNSEDNKNKNDNQKLKQDIDFEFKKFLNKLKGKEEMEDMAEVDKAEDTSPKDEYILIATEEDDDNYNIREVSTQIHDNIESLAKEWAFLENGGCLFTLFRNGKCIYHSNDVINFVDYRNGATKAIAISQDESENEFLGNLWEIKEVIVEAKREAQKKKMQEEAEKAKLSKEDKEKGQLKKLLKKYPEMGI